MFRVSPSELKSYATLSDQDEGALNLFLEMANMVTTEELGASGLSSSRLKAIELNLAAHYAIVSVEKGGITRARVGESEEGYRQDFTSKPQLSMTRFGQQAVALDTTGKLSALDAPVGKAEFRVM